MKKKVLSLLLLGAVMCCSCGKTAGPEDAASLENTEDLAEIETPAVSEVSSDASIESSESAAEEILVEEQEETKEEPSPLLLWEYEGYVDECEGYLWKDEFRDCDYDGDGLTDRVWRSWNSLEETAKYKISFGNGKTLEVPSGWETGFPHIQGADLDGDKEREILVTLTYDTSTDPNSFGDMWLFGKNKSGKYEEIRLPMESGENGAKGFNFYYTEPSHNFVHYSGDHPGASGSEILDDDYLKNYWTNDYAEDFRCVSRAEIRNDGDPFVCCYISLFPKFGTPMCFRLYYSKEDKTYKTGAFEKATGDDNEMPATLEHSPEYNEKELLTGTFCRGEGGQVKVMFGTMKEVPESGNSYLEHHEGEEEKVYELTDDPYIFLYAPYAGVYGEKVEKEAFFLYLMDHTIDCNFHVNEEGKIDYISGWYNA